MTLSQSQIQSFRRKIWRFYRKYRRNFPFRETTDPYKITVSEIMLQQTQTARVTEKYEAWVKKWPDWPHLARASNRDLLAMWSGLGYNRRALYLGKLAQAVMEKHDGKLPDDLDTLLKLPGIGPYTARAILIFAHNKPMAAVDTNIRRVIIHELKLPPSTPLLYIENYARQLLPPRRSRDWHYALMDYSRVALPHRLEAIPPISKQSKFEGSLRQIRGEIIRQLTTKRYVRISTIARILDRPEPDVLDAAVSLAREGTIIVKGNVLRLR